MTTPFEKLKSSIESLSNISEQITILIDLINKNAIQTIKHLNALKSTEWCLSESSHGLCLKVVDEEQIEDVVNICKMIKSVVETEEVIFFDKDITMIYDDKNVFLTFNDIANINKFIDEYELFFVKNG